MAQQSEQCKQSTDTRFTAIRRQMMKQTVLQFDLCRTFDHEGKTELRIILSRKLVHAQVGKQNSFSLIKMPTMADQPYLLYTIELTYSNLHGS